MSRSSELAVPERWSTTTLGDIRRDDTTTLDPAKYPDERFELYSIPAYQTGVPELVHGRDIGSAKKTVSPDTVLVSKINPRINRVWVVGDSSGLRQIGSGEWIAFSPVAAVVPRYLAYYLRQDSFCTYLASNVSGVGGSLMRVTSSVVEAFPFALPSCPEQHRIVESLDSYLTRIDNALASLERVRTKLKSYRAAVLKAAVEGRLVPTEASLARAESRAYEPAEALLARILKERRRRWEEVELAKLKAAGTTPKDDRWRANYEEPAGPDTSALRALPEGWCWTSLGQAFTVTVGATPSRSVPEYWGGGIPWVSSGEVSFCRIRNTRETITSKGLGASSTKLNPRGSVLVGMIGEGKTRGQAAILDIDACGNQNAAAIWVSKTEVPPEYVYHYLVGQYETTRRRGSGNNQPALNKARVETIPLPLPPLDEQKRIVERLERDESTIADCEATVTRERKRLNRLRQAILRWAFEGKLVDQDTTDEPAETLLAHVRAERTALAPTRKNGGHSAKGAA